MRRVVLFVMCFFWQANAMAQRPNGEILNIYLHNGHTDFMGNSLSVMLGLWPLVSQGGIQAHAHEVIYDSDGTYDRDALKQAIQDFETRRDERNVPGFIVVNSHGWGTGPDKETLQLGSMGSKGIDGDALLNLITASTRDNPKTCPKKPVVFLTSCHAGLTKNPLVVPAVAGPEVTHTTGLMAPMYDELSFLDDANLRKGILSLLPNQLLPPTTKLGGRGVDTSDLRPTFADTGAWLSDVEMSAFQGTFTNRVNSTWSTFRHQFKNSGYSSISNALLVNSLERALLSGALESWNLPSGSTMSLGDLCDGIEASASGPALLQNFLDEMPMPGEDLRDRPLFEVW